MPQKISDPYYHLGLAIVRQAVLDALNDGGLDELAWLFSPLAQMIIQRAMGLDDTGALVVTRRTVKSLTSAIQDGRAERLRHLISQKAFCVLQDWQIEGGAKDEGEYRRPTTDFVVSSVERLHRLHR